MLKVVMTSGEAITFPGDAIPEITTDGRLIVSIDGTDVAVFAGGGWQMYGRTVPKPATEVPQDAEESWEDYDDDLEDEV